MSDEPKTMKPEIIELNLLVKMRLLFSDELKIASHAEERIFSENFVREALNQKLVHAIEQRNIIKGLFFLIFASYIFLNGSDISVPGLGISLKNIPGVLPLLIVVGSFSVGMLIVNFINLQAYDALIDQFVLRMSGNGFIDPDIIKSSLEPFHFVHKLFRKQFNIHDKNTFEIGRAGKIFNIFVLLFLSLFLFVPMIFFMFYFLIISFLYLETDYLGNFARVFCLISFVFSVLLILSIVVNFKHEIMPK
jgi:hypothetical protein